MENLDQPSNSFPEDILKEVRTMAGWMQFVGIISIIGSVLGILGNFSGMANGAGANALLGILMQGFAIYIAVILIQKSTHYRNFSANSDGEALLQAMKSTHMYWMLSLVMIAINITMNILMANMR